MMWVSHGEHPSYKGTKSVAVWFGQVVGIMSYIWGVLFITQINVQVDVPRWQLGLLIWKFDGKSKHWVMGGRKGADSVASRKIHCFRKSSGKKKQIFSRNKRKLERWDFRKWSWRTNLWIWQCQGKGDLKSSWFWVLVTKVGKGWV